MYTYLRDWLARTFPYGWRGSGWQPITPLELRLSLRRLYSGSSHPWWHFFELLQPLPWRLRLSRLQLVPNELIGHPEAVEPRQDGIMQLRCIPLFMMRDTPIQSVYRIYEFMCSGLHEQVQYETEYFYYHPDWTLHDIADPLDKNKERYTFVASIIEALAVAFTWRLSLGLQRDRSHMSFAEMDANPPQTVAAPAWTQYVKPLHIPLIVEETDDHRKTPFVARNILGANNGHMYSI